MKKTLLLLLLSLPFYLIFAQGPFPPAAGIEGSTAIHKDDSKFKAWATGVELNRGWINISDKNYTINGTNKVSFGYPSYTLFKAEGTSTNVVSLGDRGSAIFTFDVPIINGTGYDFAVFENGFSDNFLELAFVEVSSDGINFVRFPSTSLSQTDTQIDGFGSIDPTNINNLAGKYRQGYGTPFDLEELKGNVNIDLNNIRFIRLIDVVGSIDPQYASYDSEGNIINDPFPTDFNSGGYDSDAIGAINIGNENYISSNFNNLNLNPDSYWNGSDNSGGFVDADIVHYKNTFDPTYSSWSGFAYSNMRDDSTGGFANQFSAITAGGMEADEENGTNYGVSYIAADWMNNNQPIPSVISFTNDSAYAFSGLYVTNSTYAYISMKNGDSYTKKFGGVSGNDPDWFKLQIWGETGDNSITDTVDFFLADYRFEDNSNDYIVNNWKWLDLSTLGKVKKLNFILKSTDNGDFGMNTPAYFCLDNVTIFENIHGLSVDEYSNFSNIVSVFPNPTTDLIKVKAPISSIISILDINGNTIYTTNSEQEISIVNLNKFASGVYFVSISYKNKAKLIKVLKI